MDGWAGPEVHAVGPLPHSDGYGLSESTQFYGESRAINPSNVCVCMCVCVALKKSMFSAATEAAQQPHDCPDVQATSEVAL